MSEKETVPPLIAHGLSVLQDAAISFAAACHTLDENKGRYAMNQLSNAALLYVSGVFAEYAKRQDGMEKTALLYASETAVTLAKASMELLSASEQRSPAQGQSDPKR